MREDMNIWLFGSGTLTDAQSWEYEFKKAVYNIMADTVELFLKLRPSSTLIENTGLLHAQMFWSFAKTATSYQILFFVTGFRYWLINLLKLIL